MFSVFTITSVFPMWGILSSSISVPSQMTKKKKFDPLHPECILSSCLFKQEHKRYCLLISVLPWPRRLWRICTQWKPMAGRRSWRPSSGISDSKTKCDQNSISCTAKKKRCIRIWKCPASKKLTLSQRYSFNLCLLQLFFFFFALHPLPLYIYFQLWKLWRDGSFPIKQDARSLLGFIQWI